MIARLLLITLLTTLMASCSRHSDEPDKSADVRQPEDSEESAGPGDSEEAEDFDRDEIVVALPSDTPYVKARIRWQELMEEIGGIGEPGELPPQFIVEGTSIGVFLHNISHENLCVSVTRVEDGERCPLGPPEECTVVNHGESREFVGPTEDTGPCSSDEFEFRVGHALERGPVWWPRPVFEEFQRETLELREEKSTESGHEEDIRALLHTSSNWPELARNELARLKERAAARARAFEIAGIDVKMPTKAQFHEALDKMWPLSREKLFSDLEAAGAVGGPGEYPPMLKVRDMGEGIEVTNLTSRGLDVALSRGLDGQVCEYEYAQLRAEESRTYYPANYRACSKGLLRFKVEDSYRDEGRLQWWSRAAIADAKAVDARNEVLNRSGPDLAIRNARSVPEVDRSMTAFPKILDDTGRADRWRRELADLRGK